MDLSKTEVARKIRQHGASGAHFLFREIREAVNISPNNKNERSRLNYFWDELKKEKTIEEVPGSRKRNKYFRIADEAKLRTLMGYRQPVTVGQNDTLPSGSAADRLGRIESALQALNEKFDEKMDQLILMWS